MLFDSKDSTLRCRNNDRGYLTMKDELGQYEAAGGDPLFNCLIQRSTPGGLE